MLHLQKILRATKAMTLDEVKKVFGSGQKACWELGISDRNWTRWVKDDLIPLKHQITLSEMYPELKIMDSKTYGEKIAARIYKRKLNK